MFFKQKDTSSHFFSKCHTPEELAQNKNSSKLTITPSSQNDETYLISDP